MYSEKIISNLEEKAIDIRMNILKIIFEAQSGHLGGSLSAVEIITSLYYQHLNIDPTNPQKEDRDRFILSKGHAAPLLYVVLADLSFFDKNELNNFRQLGSVLQGHPDKNKTPGVDMTSGSLGQGLSIGIGLALAANLNNLDYRTYVLLGDGELNEGQNWEAIMYASKMRLSNLIAIVDYNGVQLDGATCDILPMKPLKKKWESFGWRVLEVNGHNVAEILSSLERADQITDSPVVIIADTIKGKGVSFMEDDHKWHGQAPSKTQYEEAIQELQELKGAVR